MGKYKYKFAISFASEQEAHAAQVYNLLNDLVHNSNDIYYYKDGQVAARNVGQNIKRSLANVYTRSSAVVILLFSQDYINKYHSGNPATNAIKIELDAILNRKGKKRIIPVKITGHEDLAAIPGMDAGMVYVQWQDDLGVLKEKLKADTEALRQALAHKKQRRLATTLVAAILIGGLVTFYAVKQQWAKQQASHYYSAVFAQGALRQLQEQGIELVVMNGKNGQEIYTSNANRLTVQVQGWQAHDTLEVSLKGGNGLYSISPRFWVLNKPQTSFVITPPRQYPISFTGANAPVFTQQDTLLLSAGPYKQTYIKPGRTATFALPPNYNDTLVQAQLISKYYQLTTSTLTLDHGKLAVPIQYVYQPPVRYDTIVVILPPTMANLTLVSPSLLQRISVVNTNHFYSRPAINRSKQVLFTNGKDQYLLKVLPNKFRYDYTDFIIK